MNSEINSTLSNNNVRRMQGWARSVYPRDWEDRCAVVIEYFSQLGDDAAAALLKQGWSEMFAAAERDWPEAFAGWNETPPEHGA